MKGKNEYEMNFDNMAMKLIKENNDKPWLKGFYHYLLINMTYASAYNYLVRVCAFLNEEHIRRISDIRMDNYSMHLSGIKDKTNSYRIMVYSALKKFSKYIKANGYGEDYMQYVSRPKAGETEETKEKREKGFLTKSEIKKVMDNALSCDSTEKTYQWQVRDAVIISILLSTGIRSAALYKLDVSDVDIDNKTITVLEKGQKSKKVVLSDATADLLGEWLKYRTQILDGKQEDALIISEKRKNRLSQNGISYIVKEITCDIKGKHITPHKLRATFGTQLYEKTKDLYFVQKNMGHNNPRTTELYIRGNRNETSKQAAKVMNDLLT